MNPCITHQHTLIKNPISCISYWLNHILKTILKIESWVYTWGSVDCMTYG
jgi:hypothetical protein